jgi:hypothetical protein
MCGIVIPDRRHHAGDENKKEIKKMNTNKLTEIKIGSKCYKVAITAIRDWKSDDSTIIRKYLTIGAPGISEVSEAYISVFAPSPRQCDVVVETAAGSVVWTPSAGGVTGAKKTAINNWFIAVLA